MDSLGKPHCPDSRCTQIVLLLHSSLHRMLKVAEKKRKHKFAFIPKDFMLTEWNVKSRKATLKNS